MMIIGIDYHPSFQTIAFLMEETGEYVEQELNHSDGEAERFYRKLKEKGVSVRVGMEATGHARWFERLLAELGLELWVGDPAEIKAMQVRKKKTDREDARLMLKLLLENRFPRIWVPSPENRDLRQLLWHRHRLVQMRTRIMNQLQAVAMNEGYRWKKKLFSERGRAQLEKLSLAPSRGWSTFWSLGRRNGSLAASRSAATPDSFRARTPVPANNGWDTSASKAMRCCATCWEKQRKQPHGATRNGGVGMCTWRCVDTKTLPRRPWPESLPFGCTGCGATVGTIRSWSSSVRTRESSLPDMA